MVLGSLPSGSEAPLKKNDTSEATEVAHVMWTTDQFGHWAGYVLRVCAQMSMLAIVNFSMCDGNSQEFKLGVSAA